MNEPEGDPWVAGGPTPGPVHVVPFEARWADQYEELANRIRRALDGLMLDVAHVGSTAVPGLEAKPVIDLVVTVPDPADETSWLRGLQRDGWTLTVREPDWYEHRCLRLSEPAANLHVFGPGCPETGAMIAMRDHLRAHADDRDRYAAAKRAAAAETNAAGGHVLDYNARKEPVILDILRGITS